MLCTSIPPPKGTAARHTLAMLVPNSLSHTAVDLLECPSPGTTTRHGSNFSAALTECSQNAAMYQTPGTTVLGVFSKQLLRVPGLGFSLSIPLRALFNDPWFLSPPCAPCKMLTAVVALKFPSLLRLQLPHSAVHSILGNLFGELRFSNTSLGTCGAAARATLCNVVFENGRRSMSLSFYFTFFLLVSPKPFLFLAEATSPKDLHLKPTLLRSNTSGIRKQSKTTQSRHSTAATHHQVLVDHRCNTLTVRSCLTARSTWQRVVDLGPNSFGSSLP